MLEEIDEPPPGAGGFDRDRRVGREFGEELLQTRDIVGKPLLRDFAVFGQDRDLRTAFVQVDAHVYHLLGLLSQRGLRPTLRSQPISGWAGGQRAYDITNRDATFSALLCPATQILIHILSTFPQLSTHPGLHELTRLRGS